MQLTKVALARLAMKHAANAVAEELYVHTGIDYSKPVMFYALYNERCNVKCRYCDYWRQDEYPEMTPDEWRSALLSIKDFVGAYSISFSGGEPFIKPGFIDLLAWCHENGISAGATTNGSALNARNAARVVAARPFNLNVSVDAPTADLHDYLRGAPGLFKRLSDGIRHLIDEKARQGIEFPIIIKPTITSRNFRAMPDLVDWVRQVGATCLSPQPLERGPPETYDELWIEEPDLPDLEAVIERLIAMAEAGAPILTPPHMLRLIPDHFRGKTAPPSVLPCRVGTRNFVIGASGDVKLCGFPDYDAIGNLRHQSARDIWTGAKAKEVRQATYACERLCLLTCLSQKTLADKVRMGVKLLTAGRGGANKPPPAVAAPAESA